MATVTDERLEAMEARIASLDAATLVFVMFCLLQPPEEDADWPPIAEVVRRIVFMEMAARWFPDEWIEGYRMFTEDDRPSLSLIQGGDDA